MAANVAPKAVNSRPASPAQGAGLRAARAQQTREGHLCPPPVKGPGAAATYNFTSEHAHVRTRKWMCM